MKCTKIILVTMIGMALAAASAEAGWFDFLKSEPKKKVLTEKEFGEVVFGYCTCQVAAKMGIWGAGGTYEAMAKPTAREIEKAFEKENPVLTDKSGDKWNCGSAQKYINAAGQRTHGDTWYSRKFCFKLYGQYGEDAKLKEKSKMMFDETKRREPLY